MTPIVSLLCGKSNLEGDIGSTLTFLGSKLDRLYLKASELTHGQRDGELIFFGPFLARSCLEIAFTILLARFDPFRALAIRKSQASESYEPGIRNPMAFEWSADVRGGDAKEWGARPSAKDLQRGLLCKHFGDIFWQEAHTRLLDSVPIGRGLSWMANLKTIEPERFLPRMRHEADTLYSELSKAVHHESVIAMTGQYDADNVKDLMSRTWELIADLALVASFSPAALAIKHRDRLGAYEKLQKEWFAE